MTVKKMVWIVTAVLADFEESGYLYPTEDYYAETYEEAEKLRAELLEYPEYEDVWISDEPEEREFYVRE